MTKWSEPPKWFLWLCGLVIAVSACVAVAGSFLMGASLDETFHVTRLRNYLDHGWYLLDDDLTADGRLGAWVDDAYVYSPVTALWLHILNVICGVEAWSNVSTTPGAYVIRHLGVLVIGALGVLSAAAMAKIVSGSVKWAVAAAAILVAMPMWTGYAMFNLKDVPVATGYSFVTLASMMLLLSAPDCRRRRLSAAALIVAGVCLAIGTRPGIWPGLALSLMFLVVPSVLGHESCSRNWWRIGDAACAVVASMVVLAAVYPVVFLYPQLWLVGSTSESVSYRGEPYRAYVLHEVTATMPVILLTFGVIGALVRFRGRLALGRPLRSSDLLMALVIAQALFLPTALFVRPAAMSGGLRHVLFAAPAVAVLIAAGIATVAADQTSRRAGGAVLGLASLGLVLPVVVQVQLFPLGYAYINAASDLLSGELPADHWQSSTRDLAPSIPPGVFVVCGPELDDNERPLRRMPFGGESRLDASQNCASGERPTVLEPYFAKRSETALPVTSTFIALVVNNNPRPRGCTELDRVTRHRLWVEVVASRALTCPLVLPSYTGQISVDGAGAGAKYLLGGWTGDGGSDHITAEGRASLGFKLSQPARDVEVRFTGEAESDAQFLLNNTPAEAVVTADGWVVQVAGDLDDLGDSANVVVTVVPGDGPITISGVEVVTPS